MTPERGPSPQVAGLAPVPNVPEERQNIMPNETNQEQLVSGCFCGLRGLEIQMTVEQADSGSHQGRCDEDIAELLKVPEISAQLDAIGPDAIRAALKEYGAWDAEELSDDEANRARALWSACCDAKENNRELFN